MGDQGLSAAERFVGTWVLIRMEIERPDGSFDYPLGRDVAGTVTFTADGFMAVQLMARNRAKFKSGDVYSSTADERTLAAAGYLAYGGRYDVDEERGTLTNHVEVSLFPNWLGRDQHRFFAFDGDQLTLSTVQGFMAGGKGVARLVWRRRAPGEPLT